MKYIVVLHCIDVHYLCLCRGKVRSKSWQQYYLIACLSQLLVELAVYQSVECLWIHWAVPRLIVKRVDAAMATIHQCVSDALQIDSKRDGNDEEEEEDDNEKKEEEEKKERAFNSASYFFVSRSVAELFPHLFESSVVLAFCSFFPPSGLDLLAGRPHRRHGAHADSNTEAVGRRKREGCNSSNSDGGGSMSGRDESVMSRLIATCQISAIVCALMLFSGNKYFVLSFLFTIFAVYDFHFHLFSR